MESDVVWYQFDFLRSLPVTRIDIEHDNGLLENFEVTIR